MLGYIENMPRWEKTFCVVTGLLVFSAVMTATIVGCGESELEDYGYNIHTTEFIHTTQPALDEEPEEVVDDQVCRSDCPDEFLISNNTELGQPYSIGVVDEGDSPGTYLYHGHKGNRTTRLTMEYADGAHVHGKLGGNYLYYV